MAISYQVLGRPFEDNALYVRVEPGESVHRFLFDCGEKVVDPLTNAELMSVNHLCFSHFHMDHISGFDSLFRLNYDRVDEPLHVWGPEGAQELLHHRLRGFTWDLVEGKKGRWILHEITGDWVSTAVAYTREAFSTLHRQGSSSFGGDLLTTDDFILEAAILPHHVPVLAYRISEPESVNVDPQALESLDIAPGEWLQTVKNTSRDPEEILHIGGQQYRLGVLQNRLLRRSSGESIAYVTDFIWEEKAIERLTSMLSGCEIVVCESTYLEEDRELATKNYHITARQAGEIARRADAGKLILVHYSQRYQDQGAEVLLEEARSVFPESYLPESWYN